MSEKLPTIAITGLDAAEALDLQRHMRAYGGAKLDEKEIDRDAAGVLDPISIVVIAVAVPAIAGLSAWLAKNRSTEIIEQESEVRLPDGTVIVHRLRIRRKEATTDEHVAEVAAGVAGLAPGLAL